MSIAELENESFKESSSSREVIQTSIVLPAYNERKNVRPLIKELLATFDDPNMTMFTPVEIIIVDDGSTDGTRDVIRDIADEVPAIQAILLRRNFGQSAALAAGIDHAAGEWIVTMDADGQNDPADVPNLLSKLTDGYDCVSGWRRDRNDPLSKSLPSKVQTRLARLTGPEIHDFGCTLKAYQAHALHDIKLYGEGHRYIPAKLYKQGYRITECPVQHHPRSEGQTKYGWTRLVRGSVDLLFHFFWNRYSTRPIHFLGGAGLVLMGVGMTIGFHAVLLKYAYGVELVPRTPRLILTVALVLFGFQLLMFGFLAEMITKLHYDGKKPYRVERVHGRGGS